MAIDNPAPEQPDISDESTLTNVRSDVLASQSELTASILEDITFPAHPVQRLRLEGCLVRRARAASFRTDELTLIDSIIEHSDFSNSDFGRCRLRRCRATACKFTGLLAADTMFQSVRFTECVIDLAMFHRSVFRSVLFERCVLREADFDEADLTNARFAECDLRCVNLSRARVGGADFRGCMIDGLCASADGLRGAIFDTAQAPALASLLGVDLR